MFGHVATPLIDCCRRCGQPSAFTSSAFFAPLTTAFRSLYTFHLAGSSLSSKIAVVGHSGSHAPQSMHSSGLIASEFFPS
jgi:hypothetical protein